MSNEKTIQLLQKSLSLDPNDWDTRLHIAELLIADGQIEDASELLNTADTAPDNEAGRLSYAAILCHTNTDQALTLLDEIILNNKACAQAYRIKADLYRSLGSIEDARKQYSVATVIDESLEDSEFETWLQNPNQTQDTPKEPQRIAQPVTSMPHSDSDTSTTEEVEPDAFIETDSELDAIISASERFLDFSNIGGMEALKERIRMSIIHPFKNKELFKKFKKKSGGGLLFYGPPGCGKTLISRATAGECGAHFINISIHDILSKWIGEAEQRLHALFEEARRKSPTVIFIDEVDALGVKRSDAGNSASLVNTLLTEMDGTESDNDELLIIGATNTPWRVDPAFRRPGRFDHVLFVPPPDLEARMAILTIMLDGIPSKPIDVKKIAKQTEKFSGADLKALVEKSTESVLQEIMRTGKEVPLTQKHIQAEISNTRPTILEWIEQASNYASFANQSGLYDDLAEYIRKS